MSDASNLLGAVLDSMTDPVWIVGPDFELLRANRAFRKLNLRLDDPWWRDLTRRALSGRAVSAERLLVSDGAERSFLVSVTPAEGTAVFTAREVVETSRAEREDSIELAVTHIFDIDKPLDETLDDVLAFICESDGWDCAVIWLVDSGGTMLLPSAVWSRPGLDATKFRGRIEQLHFGRGRGVPGRAWARDEVVWVADLLDETGYIRAEAAARAGLHGAAAVPLHDSERIVGVLEILTRAIRPINEVRRRAMIRAGRSLGRLIVRRQMQQLIERKGQEWSLTFDTIELPIFITHPDGSIARVNRAARDLAGGAFTDILGRSIGLASHEPWTTLADTVAAVRDSRTPCSAQIIDGDRHWDVSASCSHSSTDGHGDGHGDERIIVVMRNTTDLIQLQESVRRGEQLAALGELVAGVAHEVRNPIFGMGLTVDALQTMLPDEPDFAELAGVLRTWLNRLNRLMENLLEYGKSWTLDLSEGEVAEVLDPVVNGCRQLAAQSTVAVDATVEPSLRMLMDAGRLGHAFENLITNAIQHSKPQQRVHVAARKVADGGREMIECVVRDEGPGFNPLDLPRVFQPFFTRRRGGTGLGLSIVQRIVDEHGGTIAAGNADNGGAVVTIRFPAYQGSGSHPHVVRSSATGAGADSHR
ncbi:MAG TPA: ATP-binding protein [Thermoanaerobaculia bacterium]|nr:ATP-binding protein [Thermoanaerobaculia bacterium]